LDVPPFGRARGDLWPAGGDPRPSPAVHVRVAHPPPGSEIVRPVDPADLSANPGQLKRLGHFPAVAPVHPRPAPW